MSLSHVSTTRTRRLMRIRTRLELVALLALVAAMALVLAPTGASANDWNGGGGGPAQDGGPRGGGGGGWRGEGGPPAEGEAAPTSDAAGNPSSSTYGAIGSDMVATVTDSLNLRSGPSLDSDVLTVMPTGATVQANGSPENGFYPVSYGGTTGYASGDYLTFDGGASANDGAPSEGTTDAPSGEISGESDIVSIIYAAADAYGQSREDMLRVATCESGLDPNNVTPPYDASGLFQFLPSTWASTPFADQSVFDPVANANAAAWMWSVGRRNEWVCQ